MNFTILRFDEIGSTNTEAMEQARRGAGEGLCIVSRSQSAGRGRHGRQWVSEKDAGLYFSLVLRPKMDAAFIPLITLMAAVSVYDLLKERYGLKPDIKWVNDIHINGRKISGILAETAETDQGIAIILGIGINLRSDNFPPEIADIATSIEEETKARPKFEEVLESLTHFLAYHYDDFDPERIRKEWISRSSYAFGKHVRVNLGNESITGETSGIEENGALRLKLPDGEIRIIHAGDLESLRQI